jgi:hypothetical protein
MESGLTLYLCFVWGFRVGRDHPTTPVEFVQLTAVPARLPLVHFKMLYRHWALAFHARRDAQVRWFDNVGFFVFASNEVFIAARRTFDRGAGFNL